MNINKLSDEELVEIVRSEDQEKYEILVIRYQEKLMRYAAYLIGDQDIASDAVQNAFIKAFINLKSFNTDKKFSSWIYRITHNEAINLVKKDQKLQSWDDEQWLKVASGDDIEAAYTKKQMKIAIEASLNQLPIEYRSPLALYYLDDRSYSEISDILRIPIGTVGTRINRGKKMLYKIYRKEGE